MSSKDQNAEDIDKKSQDDQKSDKKKAGEEEEAVEEIGIKWSSLYKYIIFDLTINGNYLE